MSSPNGDTHAGGQAYSSDLTNGGQIIEIDIRPADPTNTISLLGLTGLIPAAVLSSAWFDATAEIAADSVRFGVQGIEAPSLLPFCIDLDLDGRRDALFFLRKSATGLALGAAEARLTADLVGGGRGSGSDSIVVVGT